MLVSCWEGPWRYSCTTGKRVFPCEIVNLSGSSDGKESAYNAGDPGLIPGLGRFPEEGNGYPLVFLPGKFPWQRSLLPTVHGAARSQTQLSMHTYLVSGLSVGIRVVNISTVVPDTVHNDIILWIFRRVVCWRCYFSSFMLRKLTLGDESISQR